MGSALSSLRASALARSREDVVFASEDEEEDPRPAKRQRRAYSNKGISTQNDNEAGLPSPSRHVTNESTRTPPRPSAKFSMLKPSDFYGSSHSGASATQNASRGDRVTRSSKTRIDAILPKDPVDFQKAVRIDIFGIERKNAIPVNPFDPKEGRKSAADIRCRCSLALFYAKNDDDPKALQKEDYAELYRTSKMGIIRTTLKDGDYWVGKIMLPDSFLVPAEQLYVNRKERKDWPLEVASNAEFEYTFDFADKYNVQVWLEPVGSLSNWSPLLNAMLAESEPSSDDPNSEALGEVLGGRNENWNEVQLSCLTNTLLDAGRQSRAADIKLHYGRSRHKLPYSLSMDINWSLPSHLSDLEYRHQKLESPPASPLSMKTAGPSVSNSPMALKGEGYAKPSSPADSRAQRRRSNVPTYNLKTLSAQAQGRSPRVRKTRDLTPRSPQTQPEKSEGLTITYAFGRADSAELGIKQQTVLPGLMCPFCNYDHSSIEALRLHLHSNHTNFKFHLRRSHPPRMSFFVELAKNCPSPMTKNEQVRTFQLGKPVTLFDLEKFLNGDESWVKSREGPQHNLWPAHLANQCQESSVSSSPRESRHSSPNTSNDPDEEAADVEPCVRKLPLRTRKVFYVPRTNKPLYDTVTKRVLEPGEEIPSSDDEKDERWLHQKHRDVILDFTDVTSDEKDYIVQWNPFILAELVTNETFLPDAIIRFVKANKNWFAGRQSRKREFGKLMETFLLRGAITQKCFHKCIMILKDAEAKDKQKEVEDVHMNRESVEAVAWPAQRRGLLDCECGEHTQPPDRVVCRGLKCSGRFFHLECAEKSGRSIVGPWKCDGCFS